MSLLLYTLLPPTLFLGLVPAADGLSGLLNAPVISFVARLIISWTALFLCALYGVFASLALRLAGDGGLSQWTVAKAFKWTMKAGIGVEFVVHDSVGGLQRRPAVFVGNHQTELDVCMLGAVFPRYCSVTAKSSLKWVPVLGWFMALSETVFINRTSRTSALAAFSSAAQTMHSHKQSVFIFPEGTRSYASTPMLLPFKKGAFHLAVQAQVPIVPIVVANYSEVLDTRRRVFRSGRIPVKVLKPVETKGLGKEDVDALVERVRSAMLEELVVLTQKARKEGVALSESDARGMMGKTKSTGSDLGMTS
ncbi:1-acylglycerol-3-phosphate O-acyltransferase [Elasticomyces elasticus]|nr:1-acylglycerol-3-phosphate O-acyltransferase [Elasticomyces elasticus]KAK4985970.1 1-acylglycerol-3-phosphate O-acyltransferase [Elasticomyces elasticus]